MKKIAYFLFILTVVRLVSHPGSIDHRAGHIDKKTGYYHYHKQYLGGRYAPYTGEVTGTLRQILGPDRFVFLIHGQSRRYIPTRLTGISFNKNHYPALSKELLQTRKKEALKFVKTQLKNKERYTLLFEYAGERNKYACHILLGQKTLNQLLIEKNLSAYIAKPGKSYYYHNVYLKAAEK